MLAIVKATSNIPVLKSLASNRFSRANRLLNAAAYDRVFAKAIRSRDNLFTVLFRTSDGDCARLGLAISKKHCRRACGRNRIKRTVRESFRQHQKMLAGLDIVIMNKPAAASADGKTMRQSLDRHWQRCSSEKRIKTAAGQLTDG